MRANIKAYTLTGKKCQFKEQNVSIKFTFLPGQVQQGMHATSFTISNFTISVFVVSYFEISDLVLSKHKVRELI